jgi:hypothetical protein
MQIQFSKEQSARLLLDCSIGLTSNYSSQNWFPSGKNPDLLLAIFAWPGLASHLLGSSSGGELETLRLNDSLGHERSGAIGVHASACSSPASSKAPAPLGLALFLHHEQNASPDIRMSRIIVDISELGHSQETFEKLRYLTRRRGCRKG